MNEPVRRMAVVTGGAGAIGASISDALTATGHEVTVLDRAGREPVDLGDERQVQAAAHRVLETAGRCDVLVHAAAAFDQATLEQVDLALWRRVQGVNVESATPCGRRPPPGCCPMSPARGHWWRWPARWPSRMARTGSRSPAWPPG